MGDRLLNRLGITLVFLGIFGFLFINTSILGSVISGFNIDNEEPKEILEIPDIEEIITRTGARGEATQVRCKILEGRDQNKILRRNVKGPVKLKDVLMLRETEIEARRLAQTRRG